MSSTKPVQKGGIKSKIICKYFIQGKCIKGENCPYLHSQFENPKETTKVECPMYSIGFCKNGPVCHFLHIKKDKYPEEELEDKNTTTTTPLTEEQNNQIINNNVNNNSSNNSNENENNLNNEKNDEKEKNLNFTLPIWYLEHYYDKPISMIFQELEQKNLLEIAELKKKYGFTNIEPNLPLMQPINKKNKINLNMNTLNLNFNNFNMNLTSNNNRIDINNTKNNIIQNNMQINQMNKINNDIKFDAYKLKKDSIEYLINKEENIFYYLIRCKNYDEIKKSLESNTIKLTKEIYNKYKDIDIKNNKLTIILFVFDDEFENFAGFAQLKYPLSQKNGLEYDNDKENKNYMYYYKIEWLWRTKLHYSKVSHLMNREDNDQFLHEGKNGCPIDKDLGNYCCRLMIKRLSKDEVKELINEKKIFENQKNVQNLQKEEDNDFHNNYNNKNYNNNKYIYNSFEGYNKYHNYDNSYKKSNKYKESSEFTFSNNKKNYNEKNSSKYNSYNKKDFKYTGHKKYRNNSKSRSPNRRSDSEDYSSSYKNKKIKRNEDNNGNYHKYHSKNNHKDYNNYYQRYNNDDNKSTDFSSKKSFH